jgi:hypothetical protein
MYSAINDARTRPAHRAMDGVIRPVGDSFWDDHSPPCGYNCRCSLISLTGDQADARGGPTPQISPDARADPGFGARPQFGLNAVAAMVGNAMTQATGTFQDAITSWYQDISQERMAERVQDFVPSYDRVAQGVRDFLFENEGLVAEHEAVALRYYTGDGYTVMNAYLRGGVGDDMTLRAAVGAAMTALEKMPAFEGRVYRGVSSTGLKDPARFFAAHQAGEIVEYRGFTSGSYEKGFTGDILYTVHSVDGKVVEALAYEDTEREVLFRPGTRFRVLSVRKVGDTTYLELEELKDQNVAVPPSNKFAHDLPGDGQPAEKVGHALQSRAQDEANFADPHVMEKFMAEHDGMTPAEYIIATMPSVRMELAQHAPHLLPKPKD